MTRLGNPQSGEMETFVYERAGMLCIAQESDDGDESVDLVALSREQALKLRDAITKYLNKKAVQK